MKIIHFDYLWLGFDQNLIPFPLEMFVSSNENYFPHKKSRHLEETEIITEKNGLNQIGKIWFDVPIKR